MTAPDRRGLGALCRIAALMRDRSLARHARVEARARQLEETLDELRREIASASAPPPLDGLASSPGPVDLSALARRQEARRRWCAARIEALTAELALLRAEAERTGLEARRALGRWQVLDEWPAPPAGRRR